ncbi:MAG: hypothetical protein ACREEM_54280, partial [Blastocatellia bacterium]
SLFSVGDWGLGAGGWLVLASSYSFQEKEIHHEDTKSTKEERKALFSSYLRVLRFFVVSFS